MTYLNLVGRSTSELSRRQLLQSIFAATAGGMLARAQAPAIKLDSIGKNLSVLSGAGGKVTKNYRGELKTVIEDLDLPNPVIRSHHGNGFIKQYVRDHVGLPTEPASNKVADCGVKKAVENLPQLREKMGAVIDKCLDVQQDILETFVDRGQLRKLSEPTVMENGKRIPGLKSIIHVSWPSCTRWSASPTSLGVSSARGTYIVTLPRRWAHRLINIRSARSAMTCPSCAPKALSRKLNAHDDTG